MKTVIVDDEQNARESLEKLLRIFCPEVEVLDSVDCEKSAVDAISTHQPDLVFMDIELSGESGFNILSKLPRRNFQLIFVTAHNEYAIQAIRNNAIDYLLKPIDPDLLTESVQKAKERIRKFQLPNYTDLINSLEQKQNEKIGIPGQEGTKYIEIENILYLKADSNYTTIKREHEKDMLVSKPLKVFEELLKGHSFFRIHQSYLVNLKKVKEFQRIDGGVLLLGRNDIVPISRSKLSEVKRQLKIIWRSL